MSICRRLAAAGLAFALLSSLTTAAMATQRVALVIGNNQYQNLPRLEKAVADATSYADALRAKGFDQVTLKTDLTRTQMDETIAAFIEEIQPGDTAVFAYAGHGWSDGNQNFIVGTDAPASGSQQFLARVSIALKNGNDGVIDEMDQKGASLKVAIIDACRDNPFTPPAGKRGFGLSRGLARIADTPKGTFVVFSAGAGQSALDRLSDADSSPNSVFTRVFASALRSDMTLQAAIKVTQEQVVALAKSVQADQTPAYYDEVIGSACLSASCNSGASASLQPPPPQPPPPSQTREANIELVYWSSIVSSTNRADFEAYLRDYPSGTFAALARNRLAALAAPPPPPTQPPSIAPSFNCAVASAPAEVAICNDAALADMDNQLARQFSTRLMATPAASTNAFRTEQARWLQSRNACGADKDCLAHSYRARLQQLAQTSIDTGNGPSFNCRAAAAPAEIAICGDAQLAALDNQLAQQFSLKAMALPVSATAAFKAAQARWLQARNACGADKTCLANSYRLRMQQLGQ
jgi:uncharacterized protein